MPRSLPAEFWRVYGYVARNWYDSEYGAVPRAERWYQPAMLFLESLAADMGQPTVRPEDV